MRVLVLLLAVACAKQGPPPSEQPLKVVPIPEGDPTAVRMLQHGPEMEAARISLIFGQPEAARERLAVFVQREIPNDLPAELVPYYERMRDTASRVTRARSTAAVARVLAETGARCGECHAVADAEFPASLPPVPDGEDVTGHMRRHQWALDRLWEGLFQASEARWLAGGNALYEEPVAADDLAYEDEALAALADRIHDRSRFVFQDLQTEDKVTLVGDLTTTCAECHARTLLRGAE